MFAKSVKSSRSVLRTFSNVFHENKIVVCRRKLMVRPISCSTSKFDSRWKPVTADQSENRGSRLQHVQSKRHFDEPLRAVKVALNAQKKWLDVTWNDGSQTSYPYVWLRDNCQCPICFHPVSKARLVLMMDLDPEIQPKDVVVGEDGNLTITWPDGHQSPCTSEWLWERSFTETAREKRVGVLGQLHQHWGAEMQGKIPTYDYDRLCSDDDHYLLDWLMNVDRYGMTLITNAPKETPGHLRKIAKRVCFARKTSYGESFTVESKADPSNLAYTTAKLGFHCDLTYYHHVPGNTSSGGRNQFVDASYAAKILEDEYPEYYKLLCTRILDFNDIGVDEYKFNMITQWPVFIRNLRGRVTAIRYNNQSRDSFMNSVPIEDVQPVYKALRKLDDIMYDPKNHVTHMPRAGDIAAFDNTRVLHAREGYDVGSTGVRHLEGMYIDWDEIHSRTRVLKEELDI